LGFHYFDVAAKDFFNAVDVSKFKSEQGTVMNVLIIGFINLGQAYWHCDDYFPVRDVDVDDDAGDPASST
jgi:hypothetical protein